MNEEFYWLYAMVRKNISAGNRSCWCCPGACWLGLCWEQNAHSKKFWSPWRCPLLPYTHFCAWPAATLPEPRNAGPSKTLQCCCFSAPLPVLKKREESVLSWRRCKFTIPKQISIQYCAVSRVRWNSLALKDAHCYICIAFPCAGAWRHGSQPSKLLQIKTNKQQSLVINSEMKLV